MKPLARLREGTVADCAHEARFAQQRGVELVEHRLLRTRTHRQQRRDQRRQRQLPAAGEGVREIRMSRSLGELRRADEIGEVQQ